MVCPPKCVCTYIYSTQWWTNVLTYMVWPGELGMLEPGLEHILSDDERVGCGTNTGLEPITYIEHKHYVKNMSRENYKNN